jgi:hypothetical protein
VPAANAIASPATARPATGVASSIRRSMWGRKNSPSHRIPDPSGTAITPIASAHKNSAPVGDPAWGRPGIASENVPSPVQASRPVNTSEPTPAASSPGTSTSSSMAPLSPDASISKNAPSKGEPSSVLMAAKLPAAATTVAVLGGASRLTRRTARTPSPPPRAIMGASGPSTTPRLKVARAASRMPGSSIGEGGPAPALNPSAGEWPPLPGRYRIATATSSPASNSGGTGHHSGSAWKPRPLGRSVKIHSCSLLTSARKKYAAAETGTPMTAASTSSAT